MENTKQNNIFEVLSENVRAAFMDECSYVEKKKNKNDTIIRETEKFFRANKALVPFKIRLESFNEDGKNVWVFLAWKKSKKSENYQLSTAGAHNIFRFYLLIQRDEVIIKEAAIAKASQETKEKIVKRLEDFTIKYTKYLKERRSNFENQ